MTWLDRVGDTLDFMPVGTWGEWFGAAGSMLAAGGALWLLKREGDDRRDLQKAEQDRADADRRAQAARVYLTYTWRGTSSDGIAEKQSFEVVVVNRSAEVLNDITMLVGTASDAKPKDLGRKLPRLLPDGERRVILEFEGPISQGKKADERQLVKGVELVFNNSRGSWYISRDHALTYVLPEERTKLLGGFRDVDGAGL